jgi:copper chaperone CopZ
VNAMVRQIALALALLLISTGAWAAERAYSLVVDGLVCPLCAYSAKRNLSAIEGVRQIEIDYRTGWQPSPWRTGQPLRKPKCGPRSTRPASGSLISRKSAANRSSPAGRTFRTLAGTPVCASGMRSDAHKNVTESADSPLESVLWYGGYKGGVRTVA